MAKNISILFGLIFLIGGIFGFFVEDELVGFGVNTWHNIIAVITGLLAIGYGVKGGVALKGFLKLFGIIYLLFSLFSLFGWEAFNNWLNINTNDTIFHIVVAIVFLVAGFTNKK